MALSNPYDYSHPVKDPALFAGRGKILKDIDYCLGLAESDPPQYKNFAITGIRGIGKTSLLSKVVDLAEATNHAMMAVRIELDNDLAENHARLFHQIISDLQYRLAALTETPGWWQWLSRFNKRTKLEVELNLFVGKLKAAERDNAELPQALLTRGLQQLFERAREEGFEAIVICIDEANLLAKNETGLQAIRNAFQKQQGYMLFLAGTLELLNELGKVFGPIQRFFDQIPLGPLRTVEEVRECLALSLPDGEQHRVSREFANAVFGLTGGHPYGVKLAAFHAFRSMQDRGWSVMRLTPEVENMTLEGMQQLDQGTLASDYTPFVESGAGPGEYNPEPILNQDPGRSVPDMEVELESPDTPDDGGFDLDRMAEQIDDSKVVRSINKIILGALERSATDIFLRLLDDAVVVREKVNKDWRETERFPRSMHPTCIARLKIMGNLDISERRVPQQGRIKIRAENREVVIWLYITPAVNGETAHLRFERQQSPLSLSSIGFDADQVTRMETFLTSEKGLWLAAGGSNDAAVAMITAAGQFLVQQGQQIFSLGLRLPGELDAIVQYETNPRVGATASSLLGGLLQQEPDTLLVAGVEDTETAQKLARAAMGGHRLLIAMVADNAYDALQRWQRLVDDPSAVANGLRLATFLAAPGQVVGTEFLAIDDVLKAAIHRRAGTPELQRARANRGADSSP